MQQNVNNIYTKTNANAPEPKLARATIASLSIISFRYNATPRPTTNAVEILVNLDVPSLGLFLIMSFISNKV